MTRLGRSFVVGLGLVSLTSVFLAWLALRWAVTVTAFEGGDPIPPGEPPLEYASSREPRARACTTSRPLTLHLAFEWPWVHFNGGLVVTDAQRGVVYAGPVRRTLHLGRLCSDATLGRADEVELSFTWVGDLVVYRYPPAPAVSVAQVSAADALFRVSYRRANDRLIEPPLPSVVVRPQDGRP